MFFHELHVGLTFAGSQGGCLNTKPLGPAKCKCNEINMCDR